MTDSVSAIRALNATNLAKALLSATCATAVSTIAQTVGILIC
jgi:hypothetical protein